MAKITYPPLPEIPKELLEQIFTDAERKKVLLDWLSDTQRMNLHISKVLRFLGYGQIFISIMLAYIVLGKL